MCAESSTHSFIISSYCTFKIYVLLVRELVPSQSVRSGNHKTDSHCPAVVLVRYSSLYRKTSVREAIQIRLCVIPPFHPQNLQNMLYSQISNVGVFIILKSIQNQFKNGNHQQQATKSYSPRAGESPCWRRGDHFSLTLSRFGQRLLLRPCSATQPTMQTLPPAPTFALSFSSFLGGNVSPGFQVSSPPPAPRAGQ